VWVETTSRTEKRRTIVLAATCLVFLLLAAPFRPGVVLGESMAPTFRSGQVFLASRVDDPAALEQGEVVLISLDGQVLLKRIYAVGGQRIWVLRSESGQGTADRIVSSTELMALRAMASRYHDLGELLEMTIPDGYIFVLGDSQWNSLDSRQFGPIPVENIRGRVVISHLFRLWGAEGACAPVALAQEPPRGSER
jgi:signal peptidase I